MRFYEKLIRNKKAQGLAMEDLLDWVIVIIVLTAAGFMIAGAAGAAVNQKLNTHDTEHFVWKERVLSKLSYNNYGRIHVPYIDYSKFKDETLSMAFNFPDTKGKDKIFFQVVLQDSDLKKEESIFSDRAN